MKLTAGRRKGLYVLAGCRTQQEVRNDTAALACLPFRQWWWWLTGFRQVYVEAYQTLLGSQLGFLLSVWLLCRFWQSRSKDTSSMFIYWLVNIHAWTEKEIAKKNESVQEKSTWDPPYDDPTKPQKGQKGSTFTIIYAAFLSIYFGKKAQPSVKPVSREKQYSFCSGSVHQTFEVFTTMSPSDILTTRNFKMVAIRVCCRVLSDVWL